MANFIHFENSHVFSKAPVQENMTAAAAVNKSAHTVQAEEVWAKPIPFITYDRVSTLTSDKLFEDENGVLATVKFHYKKEITILNANNNNGKDSNGLAAKVFIKNSDGSDSPINQFISETDVTNESGALAFGYKPILFYSSDEPVASDKYTINCSNGIIYFTEPVTAADGKYSLSFFTYEDEKVGSFISSLQEHVNDNAIHITEALSKKWDDNVDATNLNSELISGLTGNLDKHVNDSTIHITEASSKKWDDNIDATNQNSVLLQQHVNDNAIHITEESSKKWDDNIEATNQNSALLQQHVNDGTIHITETSSKKWDDNIETTTQNSDLISGLAVILDATKDNLTSFINDVDKTLEEHVLDNDVHITDSERDAWNNNVTRTEENNNLITGITTIINSLNDTVDALDTSLDEHISDTESHLSEADREKLNNLSDDVNGELIAGLATSIIEVENDLDSHTSDTIIHITQEDRERWDNAGNTVAVEPISDIIWNLNDLLLSCIKDKDTNDNVDNGAWVKELLRANAQDNRKISEKLIGIVNYQDIYGTDSFEEATEMWIAEASNPNRKISTQLSFLYDSYVTNELFRLLFYKLDERLNNEYGASGSVSAKYMKPGLTIKYLAKVEDNIEVYPNEGYGKNRYKYITVRYRGKTSSETSISENHINWGHIPTIGRVIDRPTEHPDTFRKAMAWDVIDSEEYDNSDIIKVNIEDLDERIAVIEGVTPFNTSNVQPSETTQWIAAEFKETESINNIINKKIRGISIKVANTVSSPQYLAIFDTRTSGTKKLLGVSKGTTWKANEIAEFNFNSSIIIPSSFEVFLLDYPISTDLTGDPDKPTHYIESYTSSGNQSYRNLNGAWNSEKRSFYLTFNLVGDRLTAVEKNINSLKPVKSSIKALIPNEYSVNGTDDSGAFTTFVLPNDFYPANVQFNAIKIDTLNINGTTPTEAYLGVMALYPDGSKKALSISDNTNISGTKGSSVWYFSTPFTIEEDYKLIFYILKDKESFVEPEPIVDTNVAIGAVVYKTNVLDPYESDARWNEAQTNLNFGFIVNGSYEKGNAWAGWPACTLYKVNHVNNKDIHISSEEREKWNSLFENKVEALPSVYTGNNEVYVNCYGFEYTNPSENSIFDKIEIKFAKNLDTLTAFKAPNAPEISSGEVENNICKITVAKAKVSSTDTEIEIATSDYNTNISNEVNLSQFKFSKNIILEKGWNYRFYFYDKNDNLFAASVILNTSPERDSLLPRNSVANRYLSERYDYWGAYNFISTGLNVVANGLAVKLINSVQEHINDEKLKHLKEGDYIDISDDSNTISVTNIAESISDSNSDSLVTEASVIKYADDTKDENGNITEEGLLTRWHIENEYFHMKKSVADSLKSFNLDNYGVGDVCKGVIMNLPYLSKIKSISLVAVTASSYNQPIASKAMTWSNYRLKIVDILTGKVLATSEIGKNANTSLNTSEKGYPIGVFDFDKQIYCDANRDYYILFVNKADETANIELAYANGNGSYATYENYTFGELSPKVILPDGTIKEHPPTFSVASQDAVACKGYACDFAVDTVKSEELTHLSEEIAELRRYFISMSTYLSQLSKLQ